MGNANTRDWDLFLDNLGVASTALSQAIEAIEQAGDTIPDDEPRSLEEIRMIALDARRVSLMVAAYANGTRLFLHKERRRG
jgi:hypothetical protein